MAADIVELIVRLSGDEKALSSLENILRAKEKLSKDAINLRLDTNQAKKEIDSYQKRIDELIKKKHDIQFAANGIIDAKKNIDTVSDAIKRLQTEAKQVRLDGGNDHYLQQAIANLERQKQHWVEIQHAIENGRGGIRDIDSEIARLNELMSGTGERIKANSRELEEYRIAQKALGDEQRKQEQEASSARKQEQEERRMALMHERALAEDRARTEKQNQEEERKRLALIEEQNRAYEEQVSAIDKLASAISTLGDISRLTRDFAVGIGEAFSQMAGAFNTNVFEQVGNTLTKMATQSLVGDVGKITARYDIMSTFSDYMQLAGASADDAADALQRVNDSILGLPIGLDESAQRLRRYQMFLGDLEAATNLTIGLQKAIYAGGANEQMRQQSFYQIDRLLTVGKLNTGRQWNALIQGLGVSVRYIAEELGYSVQNVNEFAGMLSTGKVSVDEFLGALQSLGVGGSKAAARLDESLGIYKGTLESWLSNIRFAAVRGGVNVLNALNDVLESNKGAGIVDYMKTIRNAMNDLYTGIAGWMKSHPQSLTQNIDAFERLFNAVSRFSASIIAVAVFDNLSRGIDMITDALNKLPQKDVEEFFSFATTLAGPLGNVFRAVSSGLGQMLGIFQRFKNFDFEALIDSIIRKVKLFADVIEGLLSLVPDGVMRELLSFGLVFGGPVSSALGGLAKTVGVVGAALFALAKLQVPAATAALSSFGGVVASVSTALMAALPAIAAVAAAIAVLGAAYAANEKKAKEYFADTYGELSNSAKNAVQSAQLISDSYKSSQDTLQRGLGESASRAEEVKRLLNAIAQTDDAVRMRQIKPAEGLLQQEANIRQLDAIWKDHGVTVNKQTGLLDRNSRATVKNSKAVADAVRKEAEAAAYAKALETSYQKKFEAEQERELLKARRDELAAAIAEEEEKARNPYYGMPADRAPAAKSAKELQAELDEVDKSIADMDFVIRHTSEGIEVLSVKTADAMDAVEESVNSAANRIKALRNAYDEARQGAEEWAQSEFTGFDELEKKSGITIEKMKANVTAHREALESYVKNLEWYSKYLREHPELFGSAQNAYGLSVVQRQDPEELAAMVKDLKNGGENFEKAAKEYEKLLKLQEEFAREYGLTEFMGANGVQAAVDAGLLDFDGSEGIRTLQQELRELKAAEEALYGISDGSKKEELKNKTVEAAQAVVEGAEEGKALIEQSAEDGGALIDAAIGFSEEDFETKKQEYQEKGKELGEAIGAGMQEAKAAIAGEDEEDTESFAGGFRMVQTIINAIVEESLPLLQETTTTTVSNILGVALPAIEQVESRFIQAINAMIQALMRLMAAATQAANHLVREFARITAAINQAKAAVDALQQALNNLVAQSYMISIGLTGPGAGMIGRMATGGLVNSNGKASYYDKGGSIFKPKGTDIVPAMLTPGEYVMRKKAVDAIGVHTLRNLNRLNIPAAIDGLMHRAYRPSIAGLMSYNNTINRYDNRSYSVNQNIQTNNPDYPYRIANRFAHAL